MNIFKNFICKKLNSKIPKKFYKTLTDFDEESEISKHYKKLLYMKLSKIEAEKLFNEKNILINNYFKNDSTTTNFKNLYSMHGIKTHLQDIIELIKTRIASSDEKTLNKLSEYYFNIEGKMIRPFLIILMSKYVHECKYPNSKEDFFKTKIYLDYVKPFASCIEVIHNASLLHDDIIDNSGLRRNYKTAHTVYGIRPTVFGANYILSKAANIVTELNIEQLNEIFSSIIYHLTYGECQQTLEKPSLNNITNKEKIDEYFLNYMNKTYYKTGSLIASSLRGIAIIFELDDELEKSLFYIGLHLGLVFQIVDDLLDVTYDSKQIMKPNYNDLKEGIINSYLLFEISDDHTDKLKNLIQKKFSESNDFTELNKILSNGTGVQKAKCLAMDHAYSALSILDKQFFKDNKTKEVILTLISYLIKRNY